MDRGFTLIEVLITVALIAILALAGIFVLDIGGRFAAARNNERKTHLYSYLDAISKNTLRNKGIFTCVSGAIPVTSTRMASGAGNYDILPCVYPDYMEKPLYDPNGPGAHYTSLSDYDTGYNILRNAISGQITLEAPFAELGENISISR